MTTVVSFQSSRWGGARRVLVRARLATEIVLWRYGRLWAVAALLLAAAGGAALFAHLSIERESAQLRQENQALASLRLETERLAVAGQDISAEINARASTNAEKQAGLAGVLVPRVHAGEQVQSIYRLAVEQHLTFAQADFQVSGEGTTIERLQINIPTKAGYPQLRRFLEAALVALPNLSLDRLSFKRNQVGDAQIEARVYLSLWLRASEEGSEGISPVVQVVEARP